MDTCFIFELSHMPVLVDLPIEPEFKAAPEPQTRLIQNVTFFGDSAIPEGDPIYNSVFAASKLLAENGFTIVDGGGPGIMKAATDGAESVNGKTVAVYWQPKLASIFEGKNLANVTDESETFSNYMSRTLGLIEKGDAYVVCKGGTGTISEFGMVWALAKLYYGCHKPVILYGDFWDKLITSIQEQMYIDEKELGVLYNANTPEEVISLITEHEKKIAHCRYQNITGDEAAFILGARHNKTRESYNKNASAYHSTHAGQLAAQTELDEFISLVNPPARVLDIGTGPGYDAKYLSEKYSVTGIEISEKMAQIAKYEVPNINMVIGDVTLLELGESVYKGIWARNSLHHIKGEYLDETFAKIARALVDGGIFYTILREGQGESIELEDKGFDKVEYFYHFFDETELKARAEKAGLTTVKIEHSQRSHKWITGVFRK